MQALIRPRIAVTASIISSTRCMVSCPGRQLGGFSYDHERESRSQNDQCIYASDRDAEINAGHEPLRLELGFPTEHRASPFAHVKQKMGIRSEEMFKSIPKYLVL